MLLLARGEDPTQAFQAALAVFERSVQLDPRGFSFDNILETRYDFVLFLLSQGRDPSQLVTESGATFARCATTSGVTQCYENYGRLALALAEYQEAAGIDSNAAMERAASLLSNKNNDNLIDAVRARVELAALRVRTVLSAGGRPDDELHTLAENVAACYRLAVADPVCTRLDGERELLVAQAAGFDSHSGRAAMQRAERTAAQAIERNPRDADTYRLAAEVELKLGKIQEGLRTCEHGLAVNPNHALLWALRGALLARDHRPDEARAALERAFAVNPLIRRRFGGL
jgi:tetratricopeptide (TPR) repeat protein